ncbi:MAG TPA: FAD/NAD(P)-binding protein [Allosphingosinicella sp.]|uniref:FAD/NAD(P)-binding protein n=1 Tax=Allosphingosinicella sp. TaxID=2823234 RepID=UPI002EDACAF6
MRPRQVAIIGGGYSGALQALNLLRHGDARVTLIERAHRPGRGVAYSTPHADHLLNVRAGRMSAFPDQPDHFAAWLEARGEGDGASFAERRIYGTYLEELLASAPGDRLRIVRDEAVGVVATDGAERVKLRSGDEIEADTVILSIGNLPPERPRAIPADLPPSVYVEDPWSADIAADLTGDDQVLLIGTGLTAVDAALMLDAAGFQGIILAMSRRGLAPRSHDRAPHAVPDLQEPLAADLSKLLGQVRRTGEAIGWQVAVDQLRPHTQPLWAGATVEERRRFLRHLRPWWDVHRHRIAPEIANRIAGMEREGRLRFAAGKLSSIERSDDGARVSWRPRGAEEEETFTAARIVNCTGPRANIQRSGETLLDRLVSEGRVRPDPCRIGIDVDEGCRVISRDGTPSASFYAIGPMTRGALWEIVAVPDLRVQTDVLARFLSSQKLGATA